jgi:hypothetical protein
MQIFQRQRQVLGERPVMRHNPEHGPSQTMRFQSALAKLADWFETVRRARNVNLPANAVPHPLLPFTGRNTRNLSDFANEFMSRRPLEIMVPAQNLHVRVANSC